MHHGWQVDTPEPPALLAVNEQHPWPLVAGLVVARLIANGSAKLTSWPAERLRPSPQPWPPARSAVRPWMGRLYSRAILSGCSPPGLPQTSSGRDRRAAERASVRAVAARA